MIMDFTGSLVLCFTKGNNIFHFSFQSKSKSQIYMIKIAYRFSFFFFFYCNSKSRFSVCLFCGSRKIENRSKSIAKFHISFRSRIRSRTCSRIQTNVVHSRYTPNGRLPNQPTSTSKKPRRRVATVSQRRAANIRERRRMFNLNEAFDKLRKKVNILQLKCTRLLQFFSSLCFTTKNCTRWR